MGKGEEQKGAVETVSVFVPGAATPETNKSAFTDLPSSVGTEAMAVLSDSPTLEELNDRLGMLIGELKYDEYRELVGVLIQLKEEEDDARAGAKRAIPIPSLGFGGKPSGDNNPVVKTRMQRLLEFVEESGSENIRNLKIILEELGKSGKDEKIISNLALLTRLYYLKGVNMMNPENDPNVESTLKASGDRIIIVSIKGKGEYVPILSILNVDGVVMVSYTNEKDTLANAILEAGKVYVFGRMEYPFTAKNCARNIEQVLGEEGCVQMNGIMNMQMSRAGMAVECVGDEIYFYDRASKSSFKVHSRKFSSGGEAGGAENIVFKYASQSVRRRGGRVGLGSRIF